MPDPEHDLFQVTLASIGDAVIATDSDSRVVFINAAAQALIGTSGEAVKGRPLASVLPIPDLSDSGQIDGWIERVRQTGRSVDLPNPTRLVAAGDREIFIDGTASPIRCPVGQFRGVVLIFRDDTDRRRAEARLAESELRYRLIGQAANDAIWDWDLVTNRVVWNEGLQLKFGYSADDIDEDASWWVEHIHEADRPRVVDGIHAAIESGELWRDQYRYRRADGTFANVLDRGRVVHQNGKAVRMVGSMLDLTEQKKAEQSLRASEHKVRLAADAAELGIWVWHIEPDRVTWENQRTYEIFGLTQGQEPINAARFADEFVHPEDRSQFENAVARTLSTGIRFYFLGRFRRPTGELRWVEFTGQLQRGEDGRPERLLGTALDVTGRQQADERLKYQYDLNRAITDNATTAIFMMDDRSRCTFMNPAAEAMTGFKFAEVDGQILHDFIHHTRPDGSPYAMPDCPIDRALPEHFEVRDHEDLFFRKNGESFPVVCNARVIYENNVAVGTVIEVRDVTEERAAAESIRQSEANFRLLADAMPQMVWITGADGAIEFLNTRWNDYFGGSPDQLPGGDWTAALHPDDLVATRQRWSEALATGRTYQTEYRFRGQDGQYRWFLARGLSVRDENGNLQRWFGTCTDIDDNKRQQEELRDIAARLSEADRRKDEFLATLAHELRNPLAPIRMGLEVMKMGGQDAEALAEIRETMERQTQQLITLVDDLLDVSRITQGKLELRRCRGDDRRRRPQRRRSVTAMDRRGGTPFERRDARRPDRFGRRPPPVGPGDFKFAQQCGQVHARRGAN